MPCSGLGRNWPLLCGANHALRYGVGGGAPTCPVGFYIKMKSLILSAAAANALICFVGLRDAGVHHIQKCVCFGAHRGVGWCPAHRYCPAQGSAHPFRELCPRSSHRRDRLVSTPCFCHDGSVFTCIPPLSNLTWMSPMHAITYPDASIFRVQLPLAGHLSTMR